MQPCVEEFSALASGRQLALQKRASCWEREICLLSLLTGRRGQQSQQPGATVAVDVDGSPVVLVNNWLWQDPPTFGLLLQSAAA
jgi:hypothetical protein